MHNRILLIGSGVALATAAAATIEASERPRVVGKIGQDDFGFHRARLEKFRDHSQPRSPRKSFKKSSKR